MIHLFLGFILSLI